ncbi:MAG TPA: hypothetical protein VED37_12880 [Ktedonobacteraceae bacterium]|nr:hypothetical protein [Ktedonobacteraceae bacterium]
MAEFSLDGYSELLSTIKNRGYSFCRFEEINTSLAEGRPFVVLRHDIDLSLRPALEIARIEHEQGVQATYFVLLRSPFYNVFSRSNAEIMSRIHGYGHQLATHIDLAFYNDDWANALMEVEILSKCYPFINTQLVSLHSSYDLHRIPIDVFQELDNVYGSAVRGDMAYISDSTGRWRYGHPLESEAFQARKPIHLLTHPVWWVQEGEVATQKLERWLYVDYQNSRTTLREFLPKLFRLNEP